MFSKHIVEEQIKCSVCLTHFDNSQHKPLILLCGHNICKTVLDKISKVHYEDYDDEDNAVIRKTKIKCPICNKEKIYAEKPQPNYSLINIIRELNKVNSSCLIEPISKDLMIKIDKVENQLNSFVEQSKDFKNQLIKDEKELFFQHEDTQQDYEIQRKGFLKLKNYQLEWINSIQLSLEKLQKQVFQLHNPFTHKPQFPFQNIFNQPEQEVQNDQFPKLDEVFATNHKEEKSRQNSPPNLFSGNSNQQQEEPTLFNHIQRISNNLNNLFEDYPNPESSFQNTAQKKNSISMPQNQQCLFSQSKRQKIVERNNDQVFPQLSLRWDDQNFGMTIPQKEKQIELEEEKEQMIVNRNEINFSYNIGQNKKDNFVQEMDPLENNGKKYPYKILGVKPLVEKKEEEEYPNQLNSQPGIKLTEPNKTIEKEEKVQRIRNMYQSKEIFEETKLEESPNNPFQNFIEPNDIQENPFIFPQNDPLPSNDKQLSFKPVSQQLNDIFQQDNNNSNTIFKAKNLTFGKLNTAKLNNTNPKNQQSLPDPEELCDLFADRSQCQILKSDDDSQSQCPQCEYKYQDVDYDRCEDCGKSVIVQCCECDYKYDNKKCKNCSEGGGLLFKCGKICVNENYGNSCSEDGQIENEDKCENQKQQK